MTIDPHQTLDLDAYGRALAAARADLQKSISDMLKNKPGGY